MTILVVDDSSVMRTIVIRSLSDAGFGDHHVEQAENGAEGLEKARVVAPSVILSDWNMPHMDGLEFLEALRAESIDTPFGFITSDSTTEQQAQAIAAGADFLLSKPFTPADLEANLSAFL